MTRPSSQTPVSTAEAVSTLVSTLVPVSSKDRKFGTRYTEENREQKIEQDVCKWARKNGWMAVKLQDIGNTGWPDRTFLKDGKTRWIEFKGPSGRLDPKQKVRILEIRTHGGIVGVFDCVTLAVQWLEAQ